MSYTEEETNKGNNFPSIITLAIDDRIPTTNYSLEQEEDESQATKTHGVLFNSAMWSGGRWMAKFDTLAVKHNPSARLSESLRIGILHYFSDAVVFLCSSVESAVLMYLAWLDQCSARLSKELVKPTAHIVIVDSAKPGVEEFIDMCSERPEAGTHDHIGLRNCIFSALTITTSPSRSLRIAHDPASGALSLHRSDISGISYPCRRRREHLGRMWSRDNLVELHKAWWEKRVPPNPIEVLTAELTANKKYERGISSKRMIGTQADASHLTRKHGLGLLVCSGDCPMDIENFATPIIASVLAQHAIRSKHWSDKNAFLQQHFECRYYPAVTEIFNGYEHTKTSQLSDDVGLSPDENVKSLTSSVRCFWMREMRKRMRCYDRLNMTRIHVQNVRKYKTYLEKRMFGTACASCILYPWSTLLPCSHGLCGLCLEAMGSKVDEDSLISIDSCPACRFIFAGPGKFPTEPPTAAARLLALDGGGVRGIVQLEILSIVEDTIGLNLPLTAFFDIMVGTSIGKYSLAHFR